MDLNIFYLVYYFMVVKALGTLLCLTLRKVLEQMASRGPCQVILCHFALSIFQEGKVSWENNREE